MIPDYDITRAALIADRLRTRGGTPLRVVAARCTCCSAPTLWICWLGRPDELDVAEFLLTLERRLIKRAREYFDEPLSTRRATRRPVGWKLWLITWGCRTCRNMSPTEWVG